VTAAHPDGVTGDCRRWRGNGEWPSVAPSGNRYLRFLLRRELTPARAGWAIASATAGVTVLCGIVIRLVDAGDFSSLGQGMWWAVQTVTTVGYGDLVPKNTAGRFIGAVLMLSGIGFLTVVTAVITAAFLETVRRRMGDAAQQELLAKLDDLSARLQALESSLRR
jgi:voltage-gated potassium channel